MSISIIDPALHGVVGDAKKAESSARKLAEENVSTKPLKLPARKKLNRFAVKEFNYNIDRRPPK